MVYWLWKGQETEKNKSLINPELIKHNNSNNNIIIIIFNHITLKCQHIKCPNANTAKPVYNNHTWDLEKVAV